MSFALHGSVLERRKHFSTLDDLRPRVCTRHTMYVCMYVRNLYSEFFSPPLVVLGHEKLDVDFPRSRKRERVEHGGRPMRRCHE